MKIIIVGAGKVGLTVCEQLVREGHDLTVVDMQETALHRASDTMDVMTVQGNGVSSNTLQEAGAEGCQLIVAATDSDEVNMVCCLTAKNLGASYAIARIRNPEYNKDILSLQRNMRIDLVINPEHATAVEISRLLRFPSAATIDTFCRGRVELMDFRLQEGDFIVGRPLHALSGQVKRLSLLFCAVDRGGEVIIPNGGFVPETGDRLFIIGQPSGLDHFFRLLGRYAPKVRHVFLAGGGKVSRSLAGILERMDIQITLIEQNMELCRTLSAALPRTLVICGDCTDQELLESERLPASDAFVALTGRDEDNMILSLYAMQRGVGKVVSKVDRDNYVALAGTVGLESIVSPKQITAAQILQVVRGMQASQGNVMRSLYRIAGGGAEAMEFVVAPSTRNLKIPLKDLRLKRGILIAVIMRGGEIIIPEGSAELRKGDSVIIISRGNTIRDLNDIYAEQG